jgi:hypothetical protein
MEGFPFFSQYLNGKVNERLTSSPPSDCRGRFGFRLSLKLADSTQLVIKLEFKDLEKNFFEVLFFHVTVLPEDRKAKFTSVLIKYYIKLY